MSETLDIFLKQYAEDDNIWWRLGSGDMQNIFEEAVGEMESALARVRELEGENKGRNCDNCNYMFSANLKHCNTCFRTISKGYTDNWQRRDK